MNTNFIEDEKVKYKCIVKYTVQYKYLYCAVLWVISELLYEGWNFNSGNYLFTTDTK